MSRHSKMDNSPLLRLPPELRNHIYDLVFAEGGTINIDAPHYPQEIQVPTLLHTCRQLRAEASSVYYSTHIFVARVSRRHGLSPALKDWLRKIGVEGRALIRAIHLEPGLTGFRLEEAEKYSRLCAEELEIEGVAVPRGSVKLPYFEHVGWPPGRELWAGER